MTFLKEQRWLLVSGICLIIGLLALAHLAGLM